MDNASAIGLLASLPREKKLSMLANLSYHLTIVARDTYGAGGAVKEPGRLRAINEVQHRLTATVRALVDGKSNLALPDDNLAAIFFGQRDDQGLAQLLAVAFDQAAAATLGARKVSTAGA